MATFIASHRYQRLFDSIDAELLRLGDAGSKIGVFCDALDTVHEAERRKTPNERTTKTGQFFRNRNEPEVQIWSDHQSRVRYLLAVRNAQAAARLLILDCAPGELDARLQALRDGLPKIEMEPLALDAPVETTTRTPARYGAPAQ